jgi:hypothetical protein
MAVIRSIDGVGPRGRDVKDGVDGKAGGQDRQYTYMDARPGDDGEGGHNYGLPGSPRGAAGRFAKGSKWKKVK